MAVSSKRDPVPLVSALASAGCYVRWHSFLLVVIPCQRGNINKLPKQKKQGKNNSFKHLSRNNRVGYALSGEG